LKSELAALGARVAAALAIALEPIRVVQEELTGIPRGGAALK
jgi:hypothetical protein